MASTAALLQFFLFPLPNTNEIIPPEGAVVWLWIRNSLIQIFDNKSVPSFYKITGPWKNPARADSAWNENNALF